MVDEMIQTITTFQHLENVSSNVKEPISMRVLALTELYHLSPNESKDQYIRKIDTIMRNALAESFFVKSS